MEEGVVRKTQEVSQEQLQSWFWGETWWGSGRARGGGGGGGAIVLRLHRPASWLFLLRLHVTGPYTQPGFLQMLPEVRIIALVRI